MKADEDEDDDTTIGSGHYPCLPSLVALQQMRNRLHMAHDGKRLMKWSAMATGRELRKIAREIDEIYRGFYEDVKNAFILLARCRYFYPNLNAMTTENVANKAVVTVDKSMKSVTGVRITQYIILESGRDPFPFLGIDQGGKAIQEAKDAWLALLKRLIKILQLRTSFQLIEMSNKSAIKKSNVLGKIIIPRTEQTIRYILAELEELEREEFFRLKKVLAVKYRHKKKKGTECPLCKAEAEEAAKRKKEAERKLRPKCVLCRGPMKSDPNRAAKDAEKRAELQAQLDKILFIIKENDQKGIQSTAVDEFKLVAEQLREKLRSGDTLPEGTDVSKLCDACRKRYNVILPPSALTDIGNIAGDGVCRKCAKHSAGPGDGTCNICEKHSVGPMSVEISLPLPEIVKQDSKQRAPTPPATPPRVKSKESQKSVRLPPQTAVCQKHAPPPDLELGVFETDTKEIVKIVRKRNDDGTVTEEKMVITIKKETRNPGGASQEEPSATSSRIAYQSSDTSEQSNCCDKTVGLLTIPEARKRGFGLVLRRANSYYSEAASPIADPLDGYCMSTCSVMSIDSEFAQQLQEKMKSAEYSVASPSNTSNPYSNKNTIGVVTTVDAKKRSYGILLREVQSFYSPVVSKTAHPIAKCCNSLKFIDTLTEQNQIKSTHSTSSLHSTNLYSNKENILLDNTADGKMRSLDESSRQENSCYLPIASPILDIVNKHHMSTISITSNTSKKRELSEQLQITKEFLKFDTTSNIQMPSSEEIIDETECEKSSIEMQCSVTKEEPILGKREEELREQYETEQFEFAKKYSDVTGNLSRNYVDQYKRNEMIQLKRKLSEVIERELNSSLPLAEYNKNETENRQFSIVLNKKSTKANLNLGVYETDVQEIVKIVRRRNNEGILTEESKVIQFKKESRYPSETKTNNGTSANEAKIFAKISQPSIETNHFFDSRTIGIARNIGTTNNRQHILVGHREVKSHFTPFSLPMSDTLTRNCISSTSMLSVDTEFEAVCKCLINSDRNEDISSDLKAYVTSSTEFDKILDSFEPLPYIEVPSTSRNCKKSVCQSNEINTEDTNPLDSFINSNERDSEQEEN